MGKQFPLFEILPSLVLKSIASQTTMNGSFSASAGVCVCVCVYITRSTAWVLFPSFHRTLK